MKNNIKLTIIPIIWMGIIFQDGCLSFIVAENADMCTSGYKWNQTIRQCIPCLSGYLSTNCEIQCPFPYFGRNCINKCNCGIEDCHHVNGCKIISEQTNYSNILTTTNERQNHTLCLVNHKWSSADQNCISCDSGYFGINCNTKCPPLSYGLNCLSECNCSENDCHHVYGCTQVSGDFSKEVSTIKYGSVRSTLSTDIETTRSAHVFMVNRENPNTEDRHKDTDFKSESTTTIKSARIGIILLSMVSVLITLLIISTFLPEKYQIIKFKQKEVLCDF
ncbi:multiple epidermal growth factor-like domains protein 10 [Crassostrea angulata]|uniref:multiple epidermal growth factor-like domains protein 10 n=1 Tax=Magallana angulata TaxID=2784310 RepID=UPI0022B1BA0C|nr:multiple epidermal growth factor-like domains protein 10 [Crassostrea angulata]